MKNHGAYYPVLLLSLSACSEGINNQSKPMNVVYILADDLGYGDLSCTGQKLFSTPNIDKLAAEGMLFTNHYAGCTVSAPSRSALMTGQHTGHTPIRGNKEIKPEGQFPLPDNTYTIATMFKEAGFITGAFGKWGLGFPGSTGDPLNTGFDHFYGYNCQAEAHRYYPKHLWDDGKKVILEGNSRGIPTEYAPDLIQEKAIEFLETNKEKPFFLFLPYTLPHAELLVPDDSLFNCYKGKYNEKPYLPKNSEYGLNMDVMAYSPQEYPYATFAAMVTRLDAYVGEIVSKLKELGLYDNTMIMFTSDNGPHCEGGANPSFFNSSGPFRGIKRDLTEGGIRLPLIVCAPGKVAPNSTSSLICASWDMLPTFSEMSNVEIPDSVKIDGISILPTLFGEDKKQIEHEYLFWEFHEQGGSMAIRRGKWKAIKQGVLSGNEKISLYDLTTDSKENNDLSMRYPQIVSELDSLMNEAHNESPVFPFYDSSDSVK